MSECRRTADRLTPYIDQALAAGERAEVESHLASCPPCRRAAAEQGAVRQWLRADAARLRDAPLPPGLRSRCESIASDFRPAPAGAGWWARLMPAAVSAVLVLATTLIILMLATARSNTLLAAQLSADHSKCFLIEDAHAALDAGDAERELFAQYGWRLRVPPSSAAAGVRLIAARRCLYGGGRVPHLLYDADGHHISLFILQGHQREAVDTVALGQRTRTWSRGDTTYVLVSPEAAGELERAYAYVRARAEQ